MSPDPSSSSAAPIPPQEAARRAAAYLQSVVPTADAIRVEETELDENDPIWRITLSYVPRDEPFATRIYKLFYVDAPTGNIRAMRMREG